MAGTTRATPARATLAEALVELARTGLDRLAGTAPSAARRARAGLVAQVDPLTGWARLRDGELLPPSSVDAALPRGPGTGRLRRLTDADLRRHDLGRRRRLPSAALRELLGVLDGECCRFPGCTRRRRLHAHHVVQWSDGGTTDLANLLLLCPRHHTLVHAHGFRLVLRPDRQLDVRTAGGVEVRRLSPLPWRPAHELDPDRQVDAGTLAPEHVTGRIDLRYAVMVLSQQAA